MFIDEIREQPGALRDLIDAYHGQRGASTLARLSEIYPGEVQRRNPAGPVLFTGMGSSLYAADAVIPCLAEVGMDAAAREAGEWLHYGMDGTPSAGLVVAISQSGESIETRLLVEQLSGRVPIAAVT